jgi:hypothetical protein
MVESRFLFGLQNSGCFYANTIIMEKNSDPNKTHCQITVERGTIREDEKVELFEPYIAITSTNANSQN